MNENKKLAFEHTVSILGSLVSSKILVTLSGKAYQTTWCYLQFQPYYVVTH